MNSSMGFQNRCWFCKYSTVKCPVPYIPGRTWEYCKFYRTWEKPERPCKKFTAYKNEHQKGGTPCQI